MLKHPKTASLGDKLQATLTELKKAGASAGADLEKIRLEAAAREKFITSLQENIIRQIENEKVPSVKITEHDTAKWIYAAYESKAAHQHIWDTMSTFFRKEGLQVNVSRSHDGGGLREWATVSVTVCQSKTRGGGSGGGTAV